MRASRSWIRGTAAGAAALAMALLATACGSVGARGANPPKGDEATELRLGYFPNITHSTALIGVGRGYFAKHLGSGVTLRTQTFNAGPAAIEGVFSGAIDATYIGPNPAINAWSKSKGRAVKLISGAASGGVALVVKPELNGPQDLKGKKIATPQLGNTQDVALRYWLREQGLTSDTKGGGDVSIVPQANAQTIQTFATGDIQGAWVPEPFASRLVIEGNGKILLNEADLWPDKKFVITHLLVRTEFLEKNPGLVKKLLAGQVEANAFINANTTEAAHAANGAVEKITGKPLKPEVLAAAFKNLTFTNDPIASSLSASADHAVKVGLLKPVDLTGMYELGPLNELLKAKGEQPVNGL